LVNQTLARRYAVAISTLARERGIADRVGADLTAMDATIGRDGLVHDFFVSPVVARPDKERLLAEAFEKHVDPVALHSLLLLVRKRRESLLSAIVAHYLALERAARGAETLTLTSARPLSQTEREALVQKLEKIYAKRFEVTERVDPSLIGGLRLVMGDKRIDATISGRLDTLARDLMTTT
jgi:ATP synthase F1 delta subunit